MQEQFYELTALQLEEEFDAFIRENPNEEKAEELLDSFLVQI